MSLLFFTPAGNILHRCKILIFNIASLTEVDSNRLTSNAAPMSPNLNPTVPQWKSKWKEICKIVVGGWRWHEHNLKSAVPPFHDWGAIWLYKFHLIFSFFLNNTIQIHKCNIAIIWPYLEGGRKGKLQGEERPTKKNKAPTWERRRGLEGTRSRCEGEGQEKVNRIRWRTDEEDCVINFFPCWSPGQARCWWAKE